MVSPEEEAELVGDGPLLLRATGELGPFFAVRSTLDEPGWLPLAELHQPDVLRVRITAAMRTLATGAGLSPEAVEIRATASIVFLGWAARLLSPALGCAVLAGEVPRMADARWRPGVESPMPLSLPDATFDEPAVDTPAALSELIRRNAIDSAIAPLLAGVGDVFQVSTQVLWGNVASAVAGTAKLIAGSRPDLAARTETLVDAVITHPQLADKGSFRRQSANRRIFTRTTCCLFYRIPNAGMCADCVLEQKWLR